MLYEKNNKYDIIVISTILIVVLPIILPLMFLLINSGMHLIVSGIGSSLKVAFDTRNIESLSNSIFIGLCAVVIIITANIVLLWISFNANTVGHKIIYLAALIILLIPDYVFGVMGKILVDPSIGLLSKFVPETIFIDKFKSLLLISIIISLKWVLPCQAFLENRILSLGKQIYNQVQLDFHNYAQAFRLVILPSLKSTLLVIGTLVFLLGFKQYELANELTGQGAGFNSETWTAWNSKVLYGFVDYGEASLQAILVLIILSLLIYLVGKRSENIY